MDWNTKTWTVEFPQHKMTDVGTKPYLAVPWIRGHEIFFVVKKKKKNSYSSKS